MRPRVFLTLFLICLLCILGIPTPVFAAGHTGLSSSNWQQRDTAVYVVSTLNLLPAASGQPLPRLWQRTLGIHRYDVYADTEHAGLYYIELKRHDGSKVGALGYQLGWLRPRLLTGPVFGLHGDGAPAMLVRDYQRDRKVLLASFSSAVPQE